MHIQAVKETHNPEIALIILCCRQFIHTSNDHEISAFLQQNIISWKAVYQLSGIHRIRPVIYRELASHRDLIGEENLRELRNFSVYFNAFALNNKRELNRILSLLKQNNISARPFKGIDFAENIYGSIGGREFSDNDIIISESDIPGIITMMTEEGYHSKDTAFYNRFPAQYIRDYKDLLFEKMNGSVREFAVEFHFKPLRFFQSSALSFADVLGYDYLSPVKHYDATQHLQLMTLNNGVMDFYPNLRSVLDLAMIQKKVEIFDADKLNPVIRKYFYYGAHISASLLQFPEKISDKFNMSQQKFCNIMLENILEIREGKRVSASSNIYSNFKTASTFTEKILLLKSWLLLLMRPSEGDVADIYLPNYFFYYFTKPFRLLLKSSQRNMIEE